MLLFPLVDPASHVLEPVADALLVREDTFVDQQTFEIVNLPPECLDQLLMPLKLLLLLVGHSVPPYFLFSGPVTNREDCITLPQCMALQATHVVQESFN